MKDGNMVKSMTLTFFQGRVAELKALAKPGEKAKLQCADYDAFQAWRTKASQDLAEPGGSSGRSKTPDGIEESVPRVPKVRRFVPLLRIVCTD